MTQTQEADHVLILWDTRDMDGSQDIRAIHGPLTETAATMLGTTLMRLTGAQYGVFPLAKPPLTLTDAGRRALTQ